MRSLNILFRAAEIQYNAAEKNADSTAEMLIFFCLITVYFFLSQHTAPHVLAGTVQKKLLVGGGAVPVTFLLLYTHSCAQRLHFYLDFRLSVV